MATIRLERLRVTRGETVLLRDLDLEVAAGERLALLGASGAGKSTLLRAIAGVVPVAAGRVWIGERDVTGLPPGERGVGMVSQDATLQPHLDVRGNLAFPLAIRRVPEEERRRRVEAEARAFSFTGLLGRRPRTLSAGRRHEVALARTLVRRVGVLLVDEPFANLDGPRRLALQRELLEVQEGYETTLVLATNDQRVALTCGQRIAVLDGGSVVQQGAPMELFHRPATTFVAGTLGDLPMDLYPGAVHRVAGGAVVEAGPLRVRSSLPLLRGLAGRRIQLGIRPTSWSVRHDGRSSPGVEVLGTVTTRAFLGAEAAITIAVGGDTVGAVLASPGPQVGDRLRVVADPRDLHVFEDATGLALAHGL